MAGLKIRTAWLEGLIDFVFPPLCLGCGEYTENEYSICDSCRDGIDTFSQPFCLTCMGMITGTACPTCGDDALILYAYGNYTDPLEQVVVQFKFKGITRPAKLFAREIGARFGDMIKSRGNIVLVPVPLYATRENVRGYNQAEVFAGHLAEALELEVRTDLLQRVKKRKPQARLNHAERAANIRGVYEVGDSVDDGRAVMLVDDVVTSGATVREAVRTLTAAKIEVAGVISIAHAL